MDSPTPIDRPRQITKEHLRIWIWRGLVFLVGLVPVTGSITLITDNGTYATSTSSFLGYLCVVNSVVTGLIDLLARSEKSKQQSRRWFRWIAIITIIMLVGLVVLPTLG